MHFRDGLLILLVLLLTGRPLYAQEDSVPVPTDSTAQQTVTLDTVSVARAPVYMLDDERFRWQQIVAPTVLMGIGTFGLCSKWYQKRINLPVQKGAEDIRAGRYLHFDDYIQYAPAVMYFGVGFIPRQGERTAGERALVLATSSATVAILVNTLKYTVREKRPDSDKRNSFPSGHTATAFMGAELVRHEYGPLWGLGAYGIATATAVMRIYNNRHWTNDVLAGAAIGILSANVGYWLLPVERRLFHLEHRQKKWVAVPWYSGEGQYGLAFSMVF